MRANGRNYYRLHGRMTHGRASSHGVGSRAGRGRDDEAVALHGCHQVVVDVEVEIGEVGTGTTADDYFVECDQLV